ncbi:NAD(P)/FAD-dependent oxidoreductase [Streptomyces sp. NPDC087425]|uniref:NAD(P)/FAD-dependent oxidoreductase n=1 Tax=Streptomyces sp. NPDC087425 TaxID=3365787 RepID=UPI003800A781
MADRTGHAVVVGAGLSGLLTAQVLARRFARVTVIERDTVTGEAGAFRAGVPQARHVHIFWSRGLAAMDALLPGTVAELEAAGASLVGAPEEMRWLSPAEWFTGVTGASYLSVSRELLEATLRHRVLDGSPSITLLDRHEVTGLVAADGTEAVTGVRFRERGEVGQEAILDAELVVVAAGRSSRPAQWLTQLGCPAPAVERIDAHLGYSSRYFRRPDTGTGWKAMYLQGNAELPRGGVMNPIDGGRWLVTLIGQGAHQPPVEEKAWWEYAASLRSDELARALADAEPLSDPVAFRATANEWTHFERADRPPRGFLVVGDALCRFNPVYGHGMSVAATQAQEIARQLSTLGAAQFAARSGEIQRAVAQRARGAWAIATGEDRCYPDVEGPTPGLLTRLQQGYMGRVLATSNTDPLVAEALFAVLSLNRRPESLFSPRIMSRTTRRRNGSGSSNSKRL